MKNFKYFCSKISFKKTIGVTRAIKKYNTNNYKQVDDKSDSIEEIIKSSNTNLRINELNKPS
jgi:hypothetical protein